MQLDGLVAAPSVLDIQWETHIMTVTENYLFFVFEYNDFSVKPR